MHAGIHFGRGLTLRSTKATLIPATRTSGTEKRTSGDLLTDYRQRLSPEQLAWLTRGAGVVRGVPPDLEPGELESYRDGAAADR